MSVPMKYINLQACTALDAAFSKVYENQGLIFLIRD